MAMDTMAAILSWLLAAIGPSDPGTTGGAPRADAPGRGGAQTAACGLSFARWWVRPTPTTRTRHGDGAGLARCRPAHDRSRGEIPRTGRPRSSRPGRPW